MLIFPLWFSPFFHFHPIFFLVSLFLYFLPAFLARNKPNFTAILLVNLLLGWTFIGWIVALIWALSSDPQRPATAQQPAASAPQQTAPSATFFCTTCGKPNAAGARFCSQCGAALPATQR
jgi:T4 superinfection immunity protein/zinc ribbon protein